MSESDRTAVRLSGPTSIGLSGNFGQVGQKSEKSDKCRKVGQMSDVRHFRWFSVIFTLLSDCPSPTFVRHPVRHLSDNLSYSIRVFCPTFVGRPTDFVWLVRLSGPTSKIESDTNTVLDYKFIKGKLAKRTRVKIQKWITRAWVPGGPPGGPPGTGHVLGET